MCARQVEMKSYCHPRSRNNYYHVINDVEVNERKISLIQTKWKTILITENYELEKTYHNQN